MNYVLGYILDEIIGDKPIEYIVYEYDNVIMGYPVVMWNKGNTGLYDRERFVIFNDKLIDGSAKLKITQKIKEFLNKKENTAT